MNDKKDIEKGLKDLMENMTRKMAEEDKEHPFFQFLLDNIEWTKDPDTFHIMVLSPIERTVHTFVKTKFETNDILIQNIYVHYNFFENNISKLCSKMFGRACCVDRASFIINSAFKWKMTGEIPELNWNNEYTFHYPPKGTMKQWMNFVEGLQGLLYGNFQDYLFSIKEFMELCSED